MPFEPLRTDEKATSQTKRVAEFEGQMMAGCSVIGLTSVLIFALTAWPFFIVPEYRIAGLTQAFLWGMLPAWCLGTFSTVRMGLAGASGFVGGAFISAIFMFLRLDQSMLRNFVPDVPRPDYPDAWKGLVPLGFVLVSLTLAILFVPKKEFLSDAEKDASR
jgi:hypothetical protein